MNPIFIFFLVLVGAPLVELYLLIEVGSRIGALPTILLSVFTALLGAWLVRLQGVSVLFRVQQVLARGEAPAIEMLEGALLMLAGLMLLFPGFLTDAMGFLLLVTPLCRWMAVAFLRHAGVMQPLDGDFGETASNGRIRVIEGEYRRDD